jgi:hypothetical protein
MPRWAGRTATILVSGGFSAVPVVDADDRLLGVVSRGDLLRTLIRPDEHLPDELSREPTRGHGALSEEEQRFWDETVRDHQAEAGEALPAVVVGGSWGAVLLVLFGVPMAGLAIGAATGVAWLLWRFRHGRPRTT